MGNTRTTKVFFGVPGCPGAGDSPRDNIEYLDAVPDVYIPLSQRCVSCSRSGVFPWAGRRPLGTWSPRIFMTKSQWGVSGKRPGRNFIDPCPPPPPASCFPDPPQMGLPSLMAGRPLCGETTGILRASEVQQVVCGLRDRLVVASRDCGPAGVAVRTTGDITSVPKHFDLPVWAVPRPGCPRPGRCLVNISLQVRSTKLVPR